MPRTFSWLATFMVFWAETSANVIPAVVSLQSGMPIVTTGTDTKAFMIQLKLLASQVPSQIRQKTNLLVVMTSLQMLNLKARIQEKISEDK